MRRAFLLFPFAFSLTACGFVHDEHIDGPYRLVAVDVMEDMAVCYELRDGCIGRIPETVYAVGFNEKYLVVARHPNSDRSKSEYYYVERGLDGPLVDPSVSVRGPFVAAEFESEESALDCRRCLELCHVDGDPPKNEWRLDICSDCDSSHALIVYAWTRAFPIAHNPKFASVEYVTLKKRSG